MNNAPATPRSRRFARLLAPLAGLALLGTGLGAAQAHDFDHHHRSTVNVHRHLPIHRDHDRTRHHDRRDYGHHRDYRTGWRGEQRSHDRHDHRYARDGRHGPDRNHDRGLFGRW